MKRFRESITLCQLWLEIFDVDLNLIKPTQKQIIQKFSSGQLINDIFVLFNFEEESDLDKIISMCIELHNSAQIDLLSLINESTLQQVNGQNFFEGQHFFCKAIPLLKASTRDMMQCVQCLVKKGGEDLAANQPNAAFLEWCKADISRAHEIVEAAKNNDPLADEFLIFALTAGNMYEDAKEFIETSSGVQKLSGVGALGRMKFVSQLITRNALDTLLKSLRSEKDDCLYASVLMASLKILENADEINCDEILKIIEKVCESPGNESQYACAQALSQNAAQLNEQAFIHLLQALEKVDSSCIGTIREIDMGLERLLKTEFSDHAIEFITKFLSSLENTFSLYDFESFTRRLLNDSEGAFQKALVTWLLSGERSLCDGLSQIMRNIGCEDKPIVLPIKDFDLSDKEKIFICRKAIGYFFLQPVVAGSIIVSILRSCDCKAASEISNLLFDPLLVNYSGKLRDYLKNIEKEDEVYSLVQVALKRHRRYLNDLKSAGEIKELHPSNRQRQLEYLRFHDEVQLAMKESLKKSVLLSTIQHCTLLYGHKTITYIEGAEGELKPIETKLHRSEAEVEMASSDIIDPVGLNFMLLFFKTERLNT